MLVVFLILLLLAAVSFVVAASGRGTPRVNLVPLGLFFWVLVPLIQAIQALAK